MAKQRISSGGLNYVAKLSVEEAIKNAQRLKKELKGLGVSTSEALGNTKPLTEYQREILRIKQETLDLAKKKQQAAEADRKAHTSTMEGLRAERLAREEINSQIAKNKLAIQEAAMAQRAANSVSPRITQISNSQAEVAASNNAATGGTNVYTSAINAERVARARLNAELANQAIAQGTLTAETASATSATNASTTAVNRNNLTRQQSAQLLAEERYIQAQNTRELRNNAREQLNAKGSLEQRRAALIRLTTAYDRLSAVERASPSGQRLQGIVGRLNDQVLTLERTTGRSQRNVGNYLNQVWSGLRNIAYVLPGLGMAGLIGMITEPILKLIDNLDLFEKKLSLAGKQQKALNKAIGEGGEYKTAIENVSSLRINLDLARKGMYDKKAVVDEYNKSIGDTAGLVKNLDQVEQGLISNADNYVKMMLYKAAANLALKDAAEKAVAAQKQFNEDQETLKNSLNGPKYNDNTAPGLDQFVARGIAGQAAADMRKAKKEVNDLKTIAEGFQKQAADAASQMGGVLGKSNLAAVKATESAISRQISLQKRVDALLNEAKRKQLSREQEEVQAVRDKYDAIIKEVERFNSNPKNTAKVGRAGDLKAEMNGQIHAIEYRADTENLKDSLSKQKALYEEYEQYKTDFGKAEADKRYGEQIDLDKTYLEKLQEERENILRKGTGNLTQPERERILALNDSISQETKAEEKKHADLLKSLMDYQAQVRIAESQFEENKKELGKNATADEIKQLEKNHQLKLESIGEAHLKELDAFKLLYAGIDNLSDENAKMAVDNAEDALKTLKAQGFKISKELEAELKLLFKNSKDAITDRLPDRLIALANEIDQIASSVSELNEGFGKTLSTLGNIVGQAGNIKKTLKVFDSDSKATSLDKLTAGLGIFAAGASIFTGIFKLFDKSAEREAQAQYARDIQNRQQESLNKLLERQISLIDEAYGTDRILKYTQALATAQNNEKKYAEEVAGRYKTTGNLITDSFLKQINEGIDPKKITGGDFFKRDAFLTDYYKGLFGQIGDISKLSIQELSALAEGGPIDEGTQKLVENLIAAKQAVLDLNNKRNAEQVGQSLESLADSFINTLLDGTKDFGQTFEETIRKSILNGFKQQFIQEQLQSFYNELAEFSKSNGLDEDEIAILRKKYNEAVEFGEKRLKELEQATGISPVGGDTSSALNKNIRQITSDQANALEGIQRGSYDQLKVIASNSVQQVTLQTGINKTIGDLFLIARDNFASIEVNTRRTADNTERLKNIEGHLEKMAKGDGSIRGAGLGG